MGRLSNSTVDTARIDVLMVIDVLASGGAQRQLCELAALLAERGRAVHILTYHPGDFYLTFLSARNIPYIVSPAPIGRARRVWMVWTAIRELRPRTICAFLTGASLITELARLCRIHDCRLVVSERHVDVAPSWGVRARMLMHLLADHVVVNSMAQHRFIQKHAPWLEKRATCIRNCVDLSRFEPLQPKTTCHTTRFVVVGSYIRRKNHRGMLLGFRRVLDTRGVSDVSLDWYGNKLNLPDVYRDAAHLREELGLTGVVSLNDQVEHVEEIYQQADALCLPSFSEATPNAVCEAMASGLPVVASRVGDIPDIVIDGENGFLFDPHEPESIAAALRRFYELSPAERAAMGDRNRTRAKQLFDRDGFVNAWLDVLTPPSDRPWSGR